MQMESALPIVRALADGVNPLTGEAFANDSPYAEPRTLRALFTAVDLMEKEVSREKKRERLPANFGKPWTTEEDALISSLFQEGASMEDIARRTKRTKSSVRLRAEKLHLIELSPAA